MNKLKKMRRHLTSTSVIAISKMMPVGRIATEKRSKRSKRSKRKKIMGKITTEKITTERTTMENKSTEFFSLPA